jgi:hypothetical protein
MRILIALFYGLYLCVVIMIVIICIKGGYSRSSELPVYSSNGGWNTIASSTASSLTSFLTSSPLSPSRSRSPSSVEYNRLPLGDALEGGHAGHESAAGVIGSFEVNTQIRNDSTDSL